MNDEATFYMPPEATKQTFRTYERAASVAAIWPKVYKVIYSFEKHNYVLEKRNPNAD